MASVRLRALLPSSHLKRAGWTSEIFSPARARMYDVVVFQKAYDRDHISLAQSLQARGGRVVFDLCDNHLYALQDRGETDRLKRLLDMLDLADVVTASTPKMAEALAPRHALVVDDAVEFAVPSAAAEILRRARARSQPRRAARLKLVWFGAAGTERPQFGVRDLGDSIGRLNSIDSQVPIELMGITNSKNLFARHTVDAAFPVRYRRWRRATFPHHLRTNDVCLLPISLNPFTICKTSNRVVTALILGLPVITDRVPSYEEFAAAIAFGVDQRTVARYRDRTEAEADVERGRNLVASRFTSERLIAQWSAALIRATE